MAPRIDPAEFRRYKYDREVQMMLGITSSLLESISGEIAYRIRAISPPSTKAFSLIADREMNSGSNVNTLLIDIIPGTGNVDLEAFIDSHLGKIFQEPEKNSSMDRVLVINPSIKQTVLRKISSSLHNSVVWTIDQSHAKLSVVHGTHFDKDLQQILKNGYSGIYDNFPNPYFPGMNPLLKLHFLTLNFNRKGFHAFSDIVEDATRMATSFGPYKERAAIFSDFSNLLNATTKIGIAKGSARISFPWSRTKIERAFLRRYPAYVLRSSRTSLYDFDSLM